MADMRAFSDGLPRRADGAARPGAGAGAVGDPVARAGVRTAVLVEGPSDLAAVEALAVLRGRDLTAEGVCVVSMGGAMNIGHYAARLGPPGLGLRLVGLCDEREQGYFERGLERAGAPGRDIFVCAADLEEELIRALGAEKVEDIVRREGDLRAWQTFVRQPAQLGRSPERQLRRFLGTKKGRKIRYGHLLVEALAPDRVPAPLEGLLAGV
ncbi:TOPRIM nucleotidyl transferase/hydrolase domain-containing protein [Streptomyces sp. NPDC091268]|uniref:TOPRIM nucleotidyl transferase/hydrolase domain-containing protein n=1 Tax=Streptomyces sp. NPDC091268 TaxID=3365979 RepID=UPI0037F35A53